MDEEQADGSFAPSEEEEEVVVVDKPPKTASAPSSKRATTKKRAEEADEEEEQEEDDDEYQEAEEANSNKRKRSAQPKTSSSSKPPRKRRSTESSNNNSASSKSKTKTKTSSSSSSSSSANDNSSNGPPALTPAEEYFLRKDFISRHFAALITTKPEKPPQARKRKGRGGEEEEKKKKPAAATTATTTTEATTVVIEGCVVEEWNKLTVMNMNGKVLYACALVRKSIASSRLRSKQKQKSKNEGERRSRMDEEEGEGEGDAEEEEEPEEDEEKEKDVVVMVKGKKEVSLALQPGHTFKVGSKSVQLVEIIPEKDFLDGTFFLQMAGQLQQIREKAKELEAASSATSSSTSASSLLKKNTIGNGPRFRLAASKRNMRKGNYQPPRSKDDTTEQGPRRPECHYHDPNAANAVVLFKPAAELSTMKAVVVDPKLGNILRPHQRIGVKFLYDCITGNGGFKGNGAILADEMGLGKTLQSVTLLWTVLRQGVNGSPTVPKAMIVAPSSLVKNWANEVVKWLGPDKISLIAVGENNKVSAESSVTSFKKSNVDLLIISYTQVIRNIDVLKATTGLDLIICDEGHRLKNSQIKTTQTLAELPTKRKIILSGTPIQNDLEEFFSMIDFVNPGILGSREKFKKVFEEPIMAGRQPQATKEEKELGQSRSQMLSQLTSGFILRRTAEILNKYLPPKTEYTIFCKLSPLQMALYRIIVREKMESSSENKDALSCITTLKKLCNHPLLVHHLCKKHPEQYAAVKEAFPSSFSPNDVQTSLSGKMLLLDALLKEIRKKSKDKVVIVSNYTQTLEVLARLCRLRSWGYFQLDGSTAVRQRQALVDQFNAPHASEFIFLLSSKAGGVGLNLIGANRLVLFDPDWNPACDLQAMARVHRDGQKKQVYIYRMLSTGTIEEKIYQRQITKQALSASVVDAKQKSQQQSKPQFTLEELRDLFRLRLDTPCDTHDLLNCHCATASSSSSAGSSSSTNGEEEEEEEEEEIEIEEDYFDEEEEEEYTGLVRKAKKKKLTGKELDGWSHFSTVAEAQDDMLVNAQQNVVTFMFAKENSIEPTVEPPSSD
ncbi:DNA repair and recombination protein RAD54B [Balamuthia mandrillaris]